MITNTKQNWSIGSLVNIGFMKNLRVIEVKAVKDGMPDSYTLESVKGILYEFIPHNGLVKL